MYTIDDFEELLNETYPKVQLGKLEYGRGTIIRRVDPVQFNIEYHDWMHYLDEVEEDRVN